MSYFEDELKRSEGRTGESIRQAQDAILDEMHYDRLRRKGEEQDRRKHAETQIDRVLDAQDLELAGAEAVLIADAFADQLAEQGVLDSLEIDQEIPDLHVFEGIYTKIKVRNRDYSIEVRVPAHLYPRVAQLKYSAGRHMASYWWPQLLRRAAQEYNSKGPAPYADHPDSILAGLREEADALLRSSPLPLNPTAVASRIDPEGQTLLVGVVGSNGNSVTIATDRTKSPRLWNKASLATSNADLETLGSFILARTQLLPASAFVDLRTPANRPSIPSPGPAVVAVDSADSAVIDQARSLVRSALGEPALSVLREEVVDRVAHAIADAIVSGDLSTP